MIIRKTKVAINENEQMERVNSEKKKLYLLFQINTMSTILQSS